MIKTLSPSLLFHLLFLKRTVQFIEYLLIFIFHIPKDMTNLPELHFETIRRESFLTITATDYGHPMKA